MVDIYKPVLRMPFLEQRASKVIYYRNLFLLEVPNVPFLYPLFYNIFEIMFVSSLLCRKKYS